MDEIKGIDYKIVLKNLGYEAEQIDPMFIEKLDICEEEIFSSFLPRFTSKCYTIKKDEDRILLVEPDMYLPGKKIEKDLYYCDKAVLFCATVSGKTDVLIQRAEASAIEKAVLMDSIAWGALEKYCDYIETDVSAKYPDYILTNRFSAKYGDFPIGSSKDFTAILDSERKIGVSCNEAGVFSPRYSLTGILGLIRKD